jgi:sec-independent protein translocase protein TatC
MRRKTDDDLFRESTMTFGEHLEELRSCLFKALGGLVVGFLIGLYLGSSVVDFIQSPLRKALITYYTSQSTAAVKGKLEELKADGYSDEIVPFVEKERMYPEQVYVNPAELLHKLEIDVPVDERGADMVPVLLWRPIEQDKRVRTSSLGVHEPFTVFVKAALLVGALLASPWIFYQVWAFVAAGLYTHERRYVHIFLPFSLGLFFAGASLAFFFVFQPVLQFLFTFNQWMNIDPEPRINEWLGFVLILPLGFGIAFQLPLVMLFLERIGVFDVQTYLSKWRIAILVIFILSMFLTPADPGSMLLMAMPLTLLYFGGVLLCHWMPRSRSPYDEP